LKLPSAASARAGALVARTRQRDRMKVTAARIVDSCLK
jgi:hypothetical protein